MKILVTGFDPFGGEKVNPAFEAVKLLPDVIAGAEIVKLEIPTVFSRSAVVIEEAIKRENPDIVLSVGQAGGRSCVTVETVGINLANARIPDNDGEQPLNAKLQPDGKEAYFSTLPVNACIKAVQEAKLPCFASYTAGTYVCNAVMYNVLYMADKRYPNIKAGFVHVPFACEQVVTKPNGTPCMSLTDIAKSLECILTACATVTEDCEMIGGTTH